MQTTKLVSNIRSHQYKYLNEGSYNNHQYWNGHSNGFPRGKYEEETKYGQQKFDDWGAHQIVTCAFGNGFKTLAHFRWGTFLVLI